MNEVQVFDDLKVKEVNGEIFFDAESAAIGLGISEIAKSGNEVVKWSRINKYLSVDTSVDELIKRGDFITEPQFYKLAIKANNATAEKFQDWVTTEVLPAIRKTGNYSTQPALRLPANNAEMLQVVQSVNEETNKRVDSLEAKLTDLAENEQIRSWERKVLLEIRRDKVKSYLHAIVDEDQYKSTRSRLYHAISSEFKKHFMLPGYDALPRKMFESGKDFMRNWTPDEWTRAAIIGMELGNKDQLEL